MPFGVKTWHDYPNTTTPITAAALEDLETRLGAYTDTGDASSVSTAEGYTDTQIGTIVALGNVGANWQGTWSSGTTYAKGAGVVRNAQLYVAVQGSNTNHDPATDTTATWWASVTRQVGLGVDVWASQSAPASVTDWGPIINTLITGGAKRLLFSAHDFPYSTQINLAAKIGIVFQGESGAAHVNTPNTRLIWKGGAGTGPALNLNGSDSFKCEDVALVYDAASGFNGDLISLSLNAGIQASAAKFERCLIGSTDRTTRSARSLVTGDYMVDCVFQRCQFAGAQWSVRGFEAYPAGNPDNDSFRDCGFYSATNSHFCNVGRRWVIDGCTFEFGSLGSFKTPSVFDSDQTVVSSFTFKNNRLWDFIDTTQKPITQKAQATWYAEFTANNFFNTPGVHFQLDGPGSIVIEHNVLDRMASTGGVYFIDLGSPATAFKNYVSIKGNTWNASSTPANVITNIAGHGAVEIGPNDEDTTNGAVAPNVLSVGGHRRAFWAGRYLATPSLAAGQPAIVMDGKFQDGFGFITFQMPGGSASVAGKLATITFGTTMEVGYGQGLPDANHQVPLVFVEPYSISTDSVSVAESVAAGVMAVATGATLTSFDIYTKNAIPAGVKVGFAYFVPVAM